MTDTAGLFKPLVWEKATDDRIETRPGICSYVSYILLGEWVAYELTVDKRITKTIGTFASPAAAKAACQTDYEARILSTLNLDAFKARIRAEALEEVDTRLCVIEHALRAHDKFQSEFGIIYAKDDEGIYHEIDMSDGYGDSTLCEQTREALKYIASIRALKE